MLEDARIAGAARPQNESSVGADDQAGRSERLVTCGGSSVVAVSTRLSKTGQSDVRSPGQRAAGYLADGRRPADGVGLLPSAGGVGSSACRER